MSRDSSTTRSRCASYRRTWTGRRCCRRCGACLSRGASPRPPRRARVSAAAGGGAAAGALSRARGIASSTWSTASEEAMAPKTPPCIVTILCAAAWLPLSVAPVPSVMRQHSNPRSFASRIVVCTHTSVVMPPSSSRWQPVVRSRCSRSVAKKEPLPGLSMISSLGSGLSSSISSQPGSPRTSTRPHGPGCPISVPIAVDRSRLFCGRSARLGRWPSRVWMTRTPAARAAASTRCNGLMGARVAEIS
mmetsp:Transcript_12602/g.40359  ORF Transcript_12602/g.40359 Transcript_12602/m.40359 type:complete len:247 (+) Transcript_12602:1213-1953(+)